MNLLAIDTSTNNATVAISAHGNLYYDEQGAMRQHAQKLLPMIDQLLNKSGLSFNQLDGIVFGRGPGSFTGLRIACSVAKALAYAHDLSIYPVSGLAAIAFEARQSCEIGQDTAILSVIDARMNQLYWGVFTKDSYEACEQVSDAADICPLDNQPLVLAGVGFETYLSSLPESLHALIQSRQVITPDSAAMINLVQSGLIKAVTAEEAMPVYIRNQVTHGDSSG